MNRRSETRRKTIVAVGRIRGSVARIEAMLTQFAVSSGSISPDWAPATEPEDDGFFCEGRR